MIEDTLFTSSQDLESAAANKTLAEIQASSLSFKKILSVWKENPAPKKKPSSDRHVCIFIPSNMLEELIKADNGEVFEFFKSYNPARRSFGGQFVFAGRIAPATYVYDAADMNKIVFMECNGSWLDDEICAISIIR